MAKTLRRRLEGCESAEQDDVDAPHIPTPEAMLDQVPRTASHSSITLGTDVDPTHTEPAIPRDRLAKEQRSYRAYRWRPATAAEGTNSGAAVRAAVCGPVPA